MTTATSDCVVSASFLFLANLTKPSKYSNSTLVEELDYVLDLGVLPKSNSDFCFALKADLFLPTTSPKEFTISVISLMLASI
jgi:hypothetical protein